MGAGDGAHLGEAGREVGRVNAAMQVGMAAEGLASADSMAGEGTPRWLG